MSTALWTGHAERRVPMPGMTGGAPLSAGVWQDYMALALEGQDPARFEDLGQTAALGVATDGRPVTVPDVRSMDNVEAAAALIGGRPEPGGPAAWLPPRRPPPAPSSACDPVRARP